MDEFPSNPRAKYIYEVSLVVANDHATPRGNLVKW
jgi:hypothetical protein